MAIFSLVFSGILCFFPKERFSRQKHSFAMESSDPVEDTQTMCAPCSDARHQVRGIDSLSTDLCVAHRPAIPASLTARRSGCPANFEYCEVAGDGTCRCRSHIPLTYPTHKSRRFGVTGKSPAPAPAEGPSQADHDEPIPLKDLAMATLVRGDARTSPRTHSLVARSHALTCPTPHA